MGRSSPVPSAPASHRRQGHLSAVRIIRSPPVAVWCGARHVSAGRSSAPLGAPLARCGVDRTSQRAPRVCACVSTPPELGILSSRGSACSKGLEASGTRAFLPVARATHALARAPNRAGAFSCPGPRFGLSERDRGPAISHSTRPRRSDRRTTIVFTRAALLGTSGGHPQRLLASRAVAPSPEAIGPRTCIPRQVRGSSCVTRAPPVSPGSTPSAHAACESSCLEAAPQARVGARPCTGGERGTSGKSEGFPPCPPASRPFPGRRGPRIRAAPDRPSGAMRGSPIRDL